MERRNLTRFRTRLHDESGQTIVLVVLALGIFLLAVIGFGVDFTNFWFHRQAAQNAADAACTAGVMDLLSNANTGGTLGRFPGGDFDCASTTPNSPTSTTAPVPCQYAALNGYNSDGTGNDVTVSFVATSGVPGINPASIPGLLPNSIRIDVVDNVQTFFSGLLTGNRTQAVHGRATCAVLKTTAPIPLIVLNPTCAATFSIPGSGTVQIVGGPSTSIQTNTNSATGVSITGSGNVNLADGGPSFTGSNMNVFGGPQAAPSGFSGGTTGQWSFPVTPIADPFAQVPPPTQPAAAQAATSVALGVDGCPDNKGCTEYFPGLYTAPIVVQNGTAIFNNGLYYFNIPAGAFTPGNCGTPDPASCIAKPKGQCNYALTVGQNGIVRPGTNTTCPQCNNSGGSTFYLSGAGGVGGFGSVLFAANAGSPQGGHTVTDFSTSGIVCPGAKPPDPKLTLPSAVPGNVLPAPCTQDGTYIGSPTNGSATGPVRGLLFFQDRANGNNDGQPSMQGGGGLLLLGNMYFHHCPEDRSGTGAACDPTNDYKAFLQFQGNSGSGTFLLGNITADELITGGGGTVSMELDSNAVFTILKASMIQ